MRQTLLLLMLCASASAQMRADIRDIPGGLATMKVYNGGKLLFQATTEGLSAINFSKFSPDGKWLLNIADGNGYVQLWDVEKGERVKTFLSNDSNIFGADFTPDSKRLLLDFNGAVKGVERKWFAPSSVPSLWNLEPLGQIAFLSSDKGGYFRQVSFSGDGRLMVFTGSGMPASIWDAKTGTYISAIHRLVYPKGAGQVGGVGSYDARLSPDGTRTLVWYVDDRVAEYNAITGKLLKVRGKVEYDVAEAQLERFAQTGK